MLRAHKLTQPARRVDGREKEEEVAAEEEEKEWRLNRRVERKVREAAVAPTNNNINNNNNVTESRVVRGCWWCAFLNVSLALCVVVSGGIAGKEVVNRSRQNYAKPGKYEHC